MGQSRTQKLTAVLGALAVLLLLVLLATYNRDQSSDTEDHIACLPEFGGGLPGSQAYIDCRRMMDARARRSAPP